MAITLVTDSTFKSQVTDNLLPVIVEWWADWSEDNKVIAPYLEELSELKKEAIKIVRIDIDKNPSLVATYNIREIPNLFLFKNGQKEFTKKKNLTKASITQWVIENI
tara:strand:- start:467 stop:787 length:321 start_codon:yes stop_codon:yes gene_type:complete